MSCNHEAVVRERRLENLAWVGKVQIPRAPRTPDEGRQSVDVIFAIDKFGEIGIFESRCAVEPYRAFECQH